MKKYAIVASYVLATTVWLFEGALPAAAWTVPFDISGGAYGKNSKIAKGAGNSLNVVYDVDYRMKYQHRDGAGNWGPVESLTSVFSYRGDVIEDPAGRVHVVFPVTGSGDKADLMHMYKDAGGWHSSWMTSTSGDDEDEPRMALDSIGRVHLVYTRATSVMYRLWNGSWSAETYLGTCANSFYQRPDISIDSTDHIHIVYADATHVYYRRLDSGIWSTAVVIGTGSNFFAYPKIAAATPSNIVMLTFDQIGTGMLLWTSSNNGGVTWSTLQNLTPGGCPNMDADGAGNVYAAFTWLPTHSTGFSKWNGSSWSAPENVGVPGTWPGWADIATFADGTANIAFDYYGVFYVNSAPDPVPPGPATGFYADVADGRANLTWKTPLDWDTSGTMIRCRTDRYPTGVTDGSLVCDQPSGPNTQVTFLHTGLTNGLTYYYSAFAHDPTLNYATGVNAAGRPWQVTCGGAKTNRNGGWTALDGKVVTAILPDEGCIYVSEPNPSPGSGLRVISSGATLHVGDMVNVTGTLTTLLQNGYSCERVIQYPTVFPLYTTGVVRPLAMNCAAVGGAAVPPYLPGVKDATGTNNIGALVRIAGKVTLLVGSYLYLDDGSQIEDVSGRVGVMVSCPTVPALVPGNIVAVTGIVEGNIPSGWTESRRYVQLRTGSDLTLVSSNIGTVTGYIADANWTGIPGAIVSTTSGGYSTTTDSSGAYTLTGVIADSYTAVATKAGYTTASQDFTLAADQTLSLDLTINPSTGTISGLVRNSSSIGIPGATVTTNTGGYSATTNSSGGYTISAVTPGAYSVTASKTGYNSQTLTGKTVTAGGTTYANFILTASP